MVRAHDRPYLCGLRLAHALPGTRANRLLILIYHRVHPRPDPMFPGEVDAVRFDGKWRMLRALLPAAAARGGGRRAQARQATRLEPWRHLRRRLRRQRDRGAADPAASRRSGDVLRRARIPGRRAHVERLDHRGSAARAGRSL